MQNGCQLSGHEIHQVFAARGVAAGLQMWIIYGKHAEHMFFAALKLPASAHALPCANDF
jgi:hypothetical protein